MSDDLARRAAEVLHHHSIIRENQATETADLIASVAHADELREHLRQLLELYGPRNSLVAVDCRNLLLKIDRETAAQAREGDR